ncbi:RnfABCDGE type electron transport complex subunit C [Psychromonas sp. CNPT3]|uniref:electron transport complex subunit RsxC n=1 Tax=Psychromonas sp. CNPT3 TaxID=314282 RepID=UPI00006E564A|nr:electron transport complex subunit RsxC [Psychromonas sp. CNPT3]AGH81794.1 RnfABCDGE type electron transport complex subunit C [Psychromonas sp. CNPT3]
MKKNNNNRLSDKQLKHINAGRLWQFHGGIHPDENKQQSNQSSIEDAGIAPFLVISVEHRGQVPELLVNVGDSVLKGQALTKLYSGMAVQHASSSGVVVAIEKHPDLHPSGLSSLSVIIKTDALDRYINIEKPLPYWQQSSHFLIDEIQKAGIVGLGGAGFPTHLKLKGHEATQLLLINAAECEPYISADDRLMQEHANEIIAGINVLQHILNPKLTIIAIEDNKPQAIEALTEALNTTKNHIIIRKIPTLYPSGSEKQLIEIITGKQTPIGRHPTDLGIVMQNIGTVFAIKEALIDGKPLTSRIVTLTGDAIAKKGNVSVRIGTPIQYLLDKYHFNPSADQKVIIGGPMMGFTIQDLQSPITKKCNCILAPTIQEMPEAEQEQACIRCSYCADACPVELMPQQLLWYAKNQDHKKLEAYNLSSCIECGICAFVCPSTIPLVDYYRIAKAEIHTAKKESQQADIARQRHEKREARLIQSKIDRQAKHKLAAEKRKAQMQAQNGGKDIIADALARAKAKKEALQSAEQTSIPAQSNSNDAPIDLRKSGVAAAIARAKAKKAALLNTDTSSNQSVDPAPEQSNSNNEPIDPRKASVAAAIARAKAKKAALLNTDTSSNQSVDHAPEQSNNNNEPIDPRKASVAAAIARAKAKKAALLNTDASSNQSVDPAPEQSNSNNEPIDPRKAGVAAAIARAKAKKSARQSADKSADNNEINSSEKSSEQSVDHAPEQSTSNDALIDPRKASVAAAIARAKTKKEARQNAIKQDDTTAPATEIDNTKIIAERKERKAQARKYQQNKLENEMKHSVTEDADKSDLQIKKEKIAIVIARAKAKKAAQKEHK